MIERTWNGIERKLLAADGTELLNLWRWTNEQALFVRSESLPDLQPIGAVHEVAGTGQKIFIGDRRPKAGQISISIGTHGKNHEGAFTLQRELIALAPLIRGYSRVPGGTLRIASYSAVKRSFSGAAQFGGTVELTLECASPYFWQDAPPQSVISGANMIYVGGMAMTGLRLTLTASQTVTDPVMMTDAGQTTWHGVLNAGDVLVMDSREGWTVTKNGIDVSLAVTGPLPMLEAGQRTLAIPAGLSGQLNYMEGNL